MTALEIALAAFAGMIPMTLFSYLISIGAKNNFSEPRLLGHLILGKSAKENPVLRATVGWIAHYTIAVVFASMFYFVWENGFMEMTWIRATFLGFLGGLVGAFSWLLFFLFFRRRLPKTDLTAYLFQLIPAHIFFGLGVYMIYSFLKP